MAPERVKAAGRRAVLALEHLSSLLVFSGKFTLEHSSFSPRGGPIEGGDADSQQPIEGAVAICRVGNQNLAVCCATCASSLLVASALWAASRDSNALSCSPTKGYSGFSLTTFATRARRFASEFSPLA